MHRHASRVPLASLLMVSLAACASGSAPAAASPKIASGIPAPKGQPAPVVRAALRDTLQSILDRGVVDSAFPGSIAVIGNHDGPIVTVAAGHLDWAPSPVPDERTIWDLASLTKVVGMTSAMMQLVEQGKVDLDAPVQRYLPEWQGPNKDRVTVRDLITHRSGLPAF
jgi:CubicO group peptidase (beta-lactamase class C family)